MPITPDTKDWTWILHRKCDECGFEAAHFVREDVADALRANAAQWRELPAHSEVRQRPSDDRWSGLEYACHVRDVFRLYDHRLRLMLEQKDPSFPNWDQNQAAIDANYVGADPAHVADEIEDAGAALADRFDSVAGDQWNRTGTRSDGVRFTVDSFSRYLIHDPIHHLNDVKKGYDRLATGP